MSELAFPLIGGLVVFLLAVPAATVLAKLLLVLRRGSTGHLPRFGSNTTWLLIIAPVIAPVLWFVSAALHQSEPGSLIADLHDPLGSGASHDALTLALCVTSLLLFAFTLRAHRELAGRPRGGQPLPGSSRHVQRLAVLCGPHPQLRRLRVVAVSGVADPICTRGLLRPRVEVSVALAEALDDEALKGALLHEAQHAHALDPLRYFIAAGCLSLNPLASLLRSELRRWRLAREAACDEGAVHAGGEPLSLAQAIVAAATSPSARLAPAWAASLGDAQASVVRLRVGLLLGYADGRAAWSRREMPFAALAGLLVLFALLPHALGSGPLDSLHVWIEQALGPFGVH